MFFASGQARGLPPVEDEEDAELLPARPAARRPMGPGGGGSSGRLNAFRAAIGAAAAGGGVARPRPAAARPRPVVNAQKKGRGTFTYGRD